MAACMRHHSSHHVAHQLPTSPCIHFPTHAAASPQGLGGFAALYPNCGKQKNLLLVYDMHHNFASFFSSILQVSEPKNAKTGLPRAEASRSRTGTRKRYLLTTLGILSGKTADAKHLLGEAARPGRTTF